MLVVTDIYAVTTNFPTSEIYTLTAQLRRSAISIQNIAEGFGDKGLKII
jgi:four helix bundle protein